MKGRGFFGFALLGIGVVMLVFALQSKKRKGDLDQTSYDYLVKQELTRKTPGGFTEGELAALIKDKKKQAVSLLAARGLSSDGTIGSVKGLDRLVDTDPEAARAGAEALGVYLGEAIRSVTGGTWTGEMSNGRLDLELALPDGAHVWPLERVRKRVDLGPSEGLYDYAGSLAGRGEVIDLSDVKLPTEKPARRK